MEDTVPGPGATAAASDAGAERAPPPGYRDPKQRPPVAGDPGAPPFWFLLLSGVTAVAAIHELCATQPAAYLDPGFGPPRWLSALAGAAGAVLGAIVARRARSRALPWLLAGASIAISGSGYAWFFAYQHSGLFSLAAVAVPAVAGLLVGAESALAIRVLGRAALALGAIERLLDPFRIGALAIAFGILAAAATAVGLLRSAAAIGLLLAVLAVWSGSMLVFLDPRLPAHARGARWASGVALAIGFVALLGAELFVPLGHLGRHNNPIVFAERSERADYVVTSGQDAFELFIDGRLALSAIDERRYQEALVHPAMLAAPRRGSVLVLAQGHGATLREVLRHPDVDRVTLVVLDRALVELSQRLVWLRRAAGDALASPKIDVIEQEPLVWLSEARGPFDVAIVDLPDPTTYLEGKNYTRHFYRRLAEALAPDGVCVVQGTSPFGSPLTFATIERTMRSASLSTLSYHAPVPTFGDWGFVLASRRPVAQPGPELDRFFSGNTRVEAFSLPRDMLGPVDGAISTLSEQSAVETFADERERLGL